MWRMSVDRGHEEEVEEDCDGTGGDQVHEADSQGEHVGFDPEVAQEEEPVEELNATYYSIEDIDVFVLSLGQVG